MNLKLLQGRVSGRIKPKMSRNIEDFNMLNILID